MDKEELRRKRDGAIQVELDMDADDRVVLLVSRASSLFAVGHRKILRLRSPDELDPILEHPGAPWEQSLFLSLGAADPVVARTIVQTNSLIETLFPTDSEQFRLLSDISWEVMNSLVSLRFVKERLEKQINETIETVSSNMATYTEGQSPKPIPPVDNLDIEFRAFVNEVKRCLDSISELFPILSTLKFDMQDDSFDQRFSRGHFHKAQAWVEKTQGKDSPLAQMLASDQRWIGTWIAMRIAIEHPTKEKNIETQNFALEPNRNIRLPTWRFKHPRFDMDRPQNLLEVFEICIDNLLKFYEDLQIALLDGHLPPPLEITIKEIPEQLRDRNMPMRYSFVTTLERR